MKFAMRIVAIVLVLVMIAAVIAFVSWYVTLLAVARALLAGVVLLAVWRLVQWRYRIDVRQYPDEVRSARRHNLAPETVPMPSIRRYRAWYLLPSFAALGTLAGLVQDARTVSLAFAAAESAIVVLTCALVTIFWGPDRLQRPVFEKFERR